MEEGMQVEERIKGWEGIGRIGRIEGIIGRMEDDRERKV